MFATLYDKYGYKHFVIVLNNSLGLAGIPEIYSK